MSCGFKTRYGVESSPQWRRKVYFGGDDGFVYCLNAENGKKYGHSGRTDGNFIPGDSKRLLYVGSSEDSLYVLNANDGGSVLNLEPLPQFLPHRRWTTVKPILPVRVTVSFTALMEKAVPGRGKFYSSVMAGRFGTGYRADATADIRFAMENRVISDPNNQRQAGDHRRKHFDSNWQQHLYDWK